MLVKSVLFYLKQLHRYATRWGQAAGYQPRPQAGG